MKTTLLDKDPLIPGTCEWCGKDCELEDTCCSLSCEAQLHRIEAVQGRMLIRAIKRWRIKPNHAGRTDMLRELQSKVDRMLRTDRRRRETFGAERRDLAEALKQQEATKTKKPEPDTEKESPNAV